MSLTDRIKAASAYTFGSVSQVTRDFTQTTGVPFILPVVGILIVITLVIVGIVIGIKARATRPAKTLLGPVDLFIPTSPVIVDKPTVKAAMSNSYTLAMYFKMDSIPDMRTQDTPVLSWPNVWTMNYRPTQEQLVLVFSQVKTSSKAPEPDTVVANGITLQRWNQLVISFEGRTVDIYCNGALVTSTTLDNVPPVPTSSITLIPSNIMGQTAYIQVWPRRLTMSEVAHNYVETSDSQGRPYLQPEFLKVFKVPNIFCLNGQCDGESVKAGDGLKWEFPYR